MNGLWAGYYVLLAAVGVGVPFALRRWPARRRRALVLAVAAGVVAVSTAVMLEHPDRVLVYHWTPFTPPSAPAQPPTANV